VARRRRGPARTPTGHPRADRDHDARPDELDGFWLADYLPDHAAAERARFTGVDRIAAGLGGAVTNEAIPIPRDCTDGFVEAFYARPEALLDPVVRAAQSAWEFIDADAATRGLARLATDLASGDWDARHGRFRSLPSYEGPLRLITSRS
jgi:hypothetical protein